MSLDETQVKKAVNQYVDELTYAGEVDEADRQEGYARLYDNVKMMKVLQKMMIEDTKEMMKTDCFQGEFIRGARYGMFMRVKSIYDKAKEMYEKEHNEVE